MLGVINISAYRFVELTNLKELRETLTSFCKSNGLKGTILLSTEGINLFVAGDETAVNKLLKLLGSTSGLEGLEPKVSRSETQPFNRMLVRIKREIISFGMERIRPANYTSPKISPTELKRWLDEGRPLTLLDTRNDYEVKLGTFRGAVVPNIKTFREFPAAVRALPEDLKTAPVVMFCTGGIRCEKAGPFMEEAGYQNIYQLDGGILKYFEECGGEHYDGECFVFDQRVGAFKNNDLDLNKEEYLNLLLAYKMSIKKDIALSFYKESIEKKINEIQNKFKLQDNSIIEIQKLFLQGIKEDSYVSKDTLDFIIDSAILKTI